MERQSYYDETENQINKDTSDKQKKLKKIEETSLNQKVLPEVIIYAIISKKN